VKGFAQNIAKRCLRIAVSALIAGAITSAPYLLLDLGVWKDSLSLFPGGIVFVAWIGSPFVGSMVFTLLCRDKPKWLYGVGFALAAAIAAAGTWAWQVTDIDRSFPFPNVLYLGLTMFAFGIGGATAGFLTARSTLGERSHDKRMTLKPWHLGGAVAVVEIAVGAILTAVGV
jgi:hypothetical protein